MTTAWRRVVATLILCLSLVALSASCSVPRQTYDLFALGSVLSVVDYSGDEALRIYVENLTADVQRAVDVTSADSDLARFNLAPDEEVVAVSALTYDMVVCAKTCYQLTEGLYDPTAYWSVDLWGFLPRAAGVRMPYDRTPDEVGAYPLPDEAYVEGFRALTDFSKIEAVHAEGTADYYLVKHGTARVIAGDTYYARLDLGGIAKGYVVEKTRAFCRQQGIGRGYLSFGRSSLLLLGNRKGEDWDLSLSHPREEGVYCTLRAHNVVASTSGDYQNYYEWEGVRYSHIIDVRTGRPYQGELMTVTVLGGDATVGDALSTALTVGGLDRLEAFAQSAYAAEAGLAFVAAYREDEQIKIYATLRVDAHI